MKNYLIIIAILLLVGVAGFFWHSTQVSTDNKIDDIISKHERERDSFNFIFSQIQLKKDTVLIKINQTTTKYEKIYEKINIDSSFVYQHMLLQELLTMHRQLDSSGCQ
jgi:uncharacterized protein YxeA